jgi:dTMP kinase
MSARRFIVFEGGEGAGKSTQARLLAEALRERGREAVLTREHGGTPGGEAIRQLLLDPTGPGWGSEAEALLFAAARSDHVARLIRPALDRGAWVICARFIDSTRAYQGGGGGLDDEEILALHRIGSGGLLPDLTILLEAAPDEIAERLARREGGESDRIGGREAEFHERVGQAFRRFAEAEPARFVRIDGSGPPEETHRAILAALAPMLEEGP